MKSNKYMLASLVLIFITMFGVLLEEELSFCLLEIEIESKNMGGSASRECHPPFLSWILKASITPKSLREVGAYLRERESVKNVRREIGK